jgi:hypothetical protein
MKIEGPGSTSGASRSRKSSSSGKAGDFQSHLHADSAETSGARPTQTIAMVDSLLALQGADDPTARAARRRMRERSENIVNELEKIRTGMLTGQLTVGHMIDVADVVASHRENIMDPHLTALMDEVDLRAQVELAKMRKALDSQTRN